MLMGERYGFWMVCVLLVCIVGYVYLNADGLAPEPNDTIRAVSDEQDVAPGAFSVSSAGADSMAAPVSLSVATNPVGASIYIDSAFVGISPLRGIATTMGAHHIVVHKPDFSDLDTLVTFKDSATLLKVTLRKSRHSTLAMAGDNSAVPGEAPVAERPPQESEPRPLEEAPAASTLPAVAPESSAPLASRPQEPAEEAPARQEEPRALPMDRTPEASPTVASRADAEQKAPEPQGGTLQIDSEPAGAQVILDGQDVGVTPLVLSDVDPGAASLTLSLDGYTEYVTTVIVEAQENKQVHGALEALQGTLSVLVKPWGTIYIDGEMKKSESDRLYVAKLAPGFHRLRIEHPSLGQWEQVVDVKAGVDLPITVDFNIDETESQD